MHDERIEKIFGCFYFGTSQIAKWKWVAFLKNKVKSEGWLVSRSLDRQGDEGCIEKSVGHLCCPKLREHQQERLERKRAIITKNWWITLGDVVKVATEVETSGLWWLWMTAGGQWNHITMRLTVLIEVFHYGHLGRNRPEDQSLVRDRTGSMEMDSCSSKSHNHNDEWLRNPWKDQNAEVYLLEQLGYSKVEGSCGWRIIQEDDCEVRGVMGPHWPRSRNCV